MKVSELFDPYQAHNLAKPLDKEVEKVDDPDHLVSIIETHCKSMLAAYRATGKVLYRGVADADSSKSVSHHHRNPAKQKTRADG